jgi:hypothetical protein
MILGQPLLGVEVRVSGFLFRKPAGSGIMDRSPLLASREHDSQNRHLNSAVQRAAESSVDFHLGAHIDPEWVLEKFRMPFDAEVVQNLKKAVYAIGQRGRRWFSGGSGVSERMASTVLDYLVLVELLLQSRDDLRSHRDDLLDCREQLVMQVNRLTEGEPERVAALINTLVHRFRQQLADEQRPAKAR